MAQVSLIGGVENTVNSKPQGGTITVTNPSTLTMIYIQIYVGGVQVSWAKVQLSGTTVYDYPGNATITIIAGVNVTATVT